MASSSSSTGRTKPSDDQSNETSKNTVESNEGKTKHKSNDRLDVPPPRGIQPY
jgi:hypothetical protein